MSLFGKCIFVLSVHKMTDIDNHLTFSKRGRHNARIFIKMLIYHKEYEFLFNVYLKKSFLYY